jgi:hypothetical protein
MLYRTYTEIVGNIMKGGSLLAPRGRGSTAKSKIHEDVCLGLHVHLRQNWWWVVGGGRQPQTTKGFFFVEAWIFTTTSCTVFTLPVCWWQLKQFVELT